MYYVDIVHLMIPFEVELEFGKPAYKQIVYAAHKAVERGDLKSGDRFPSVRSMSKELKINPNTVHKAIGLLVEQGLLEPKPGIGTIVSSDYQPDSEGTGELMHEVIKPMITEAKKRGVDQDDFIKLIREEWDK